MVATALLSDDRIGLAGALYGAVNQEVATYEDGPSVSKHKVDGAAFSRYSSIEGILIPLNRAPMDQGEARS